MIKFIWDIVKQLPPLLLFPIGLALGCFLLWVLAHAIGIYLMGALMALTTFLFVLSICNSAKDKQ